VRSKKSNYSDGQKQKFSRKVAWFKRKVWGLGPGSGIEHQVQSQRLKKKKDYEGTVDTRSLGKSFQCNMDGKSWPSSQVRDSEPIRETLSDIY
jgi:hypothetical protein